MMYTRLWLLQHLGDHLAGAIICCDFPAFGKIWHQATATIQLNGECCDGGQNKILQLLTVMEFSSMLGLSVLESPPMLLLTMASLECVLCTTLYGLAASSGRCGL
jgi:hypothetical protein